MSTNELSNFNDLPEIDFLINALATIQILCYKKIITEYTVITMGKELINGYIKKHGDTQLIINTDNVQQFRDWLRGKVFDELGKN